MPDESRVEFKEEKATVDAASNEQGSKQIKLIDKPEMGEFRLILRHTVQALLNQIDNPHSSFILFLLGGLFGFGVGAVWGHLISSISGSLCMSFGMSAILAPVGAGIGHLLDIRRNKLSAK